MTQPKPPTRGWSEDIIEGAEDWHEVISVYDNIGYEWDDLLAWYSPSQRRYFWISAGGCSCNDISDYMETLSDFEDGSRDDLARAVRAFCESAYNISSGEKANAVAEVRRYKEPIA